MEEWQENGRRVRGQQGILAAAGCRVSGETKLTDSANGQQTRRGCASRMHVHRSCAPMKSRVRQIHVGQNQDEHGQEQKRHQNDQSPRIYRPAPHGTED
jgi:hypothetical protein